MKQQPEVNVVNKVFDFVITIYKNEIKNASKEFNSFGIVFPNKKAYSRGFISWFLLQHIIDKAFTPMQLAYNLPLDYFTSEEKQIIRNFIHFNESVFLIKSRQGKEYSVQDVRDNKNYKIMTLALDFPLEEGSHILATIIKSVKGNYFFYGNILPYGAEEAKAMIKIAKNSPKNKPKIPEIEWDIEYAKSK